MLFLSVVSAQEVNPALPAACQTALSTTLQSISRDCGPAVYNITVNPILAFTAATENAFFTSLCSDSCRNSANTGIANLKAPCGTQSIVTGMNLTSDVLAKGFTAINAIGCTKEGSNFCIPQVYQSLLKSGLDPMNTNTIATSFLKFAADKTLACTSCSLQVVDGLAKNADAFGPAASALVQITSQVTTQCQASGLSGPKNNAQSMSIGALASLLILTVVF